MNTAQVYPVGRVLYYSRVTAANAGYDGTTPNTLVPFNKGVPLAINVSYVEGTLIEILCEGATATEIYNIFIDVDGSGPRLFHSISITTTRHTKETLTDKVIPASAKLYASTVAGVDAMIYIHGDAYA